MSFENLKRNRDQISKLVQAAEAVGGSGESKYQPDERIWKPTVDKAGNGYAVIRFLPASEGAELPWVRYWDHGFKGPTGLWYIENSLTSIGQPDPVGELNSRLWNSGIESDKDKARVQKRRLHYVTNILVLQDPSNPQNEGKVFLYQFGKKIFDKIMDVMQPSFADETPVNPFDFWDGADFKLKIRNVEGYRNYDKSEFSSASALYESDESKLEAVYNQLHNLSEYTDPKNYKSYDELKAKLMRVLGEEADMGAPTVQQMNTVNDPAPMPEPVQAPVTAEEMNKQDDDDTMSYFAKLANEG
jgi:hypothetical protein|tara:strand:+ start:1193 stop:2095 length:903 start_codon:yes stop_codon:yes gene_type:complete